jgi:hypothetical protein
MQRAMWSMPVVVSFLLDEDSAQVRQVPSDDFSLARPLVRRAIRRSGNDDLG